MKKGWRRVIFIIAFGILLVLLLFRLFYRDKIKHINSVLDIDISSCSMKNNQASYTSIIGDGDFFAKLECDEKINNEIESKWKKFPLDSEIEKALDLEWCYEDGCKTSMERFGIPNNSNFYYYFLDRYVNSNTENDEGLNNRNSYNYSIGIYDKSNKTIYFYELNT